MLYKVLCQAFCERKTCNIGILKDAAFLTQRPWLQLYYLLAFSAACAAARRAMGTRKGEQDT